MRKRCQKLSNNINFKYKKSKEDLEKVFKKAKQQKKTIAVLQSRILEGTRSVTQDQKRSADEAGMNGNTKPQPQKRSRNDTLGNEAIYHERRDSPRFPRTIDREDTPQALTPSPSVASSSAKKLTPPTHNTPTPKATLVNFRGHMPYNKERKFSSTRLARPVRDQCTNYI